MPPMIACIGPAAFESPAGRMPGELRSRHLLVRVAEITAVIAVVGLAISALPGLDECAPLALKTVKLPASSQPG
jgi:hypothetical protein